MFDNFEIMGSQSSSSSASSSVVSSPSATPLTPLKPPSTATLRPRRIFHYAQHTRNITSTASGSIVRDIDKAMNMQLVRIHNTSQNKVFYYTTTKSGEPSQRNDYCHAKVIDLVYGTTVAEMLDKLKRRHPEKLFTLGDIMYASRDEVMPR